ncbi:hypothetical protein APR50_39425 [Variovorax paradoxus]|nr:hypothetical protein APR52_42580 [Variovorax paradoxus]KPU92786.1 hypothetical protein APR50_39425 [Variovorax paradoxus]KPU93939.1 hypothetical protein APR49_38785 [Variovorax paradoxus]KPV14589.1 hypothetical protein APR51_38385 [Variovorax paradoxus]KPV21172.1 hypothetical protein APR48_38195 [Variovorax paradoxus]
MADFCDKLPQKYQPSLIPDRGGSGRQLNYAATVAAVASGAETAWPSTTGTLLAAGFEPTFLRFAATLGAAVFFAATGRFAVVA